MTNASLTRPALRARDVITTLFEGCAGLLELRTKPATGGVVSQWFFEPSDTDALAAFVAAHRDDHVWFGVASRRDRSSGALDNCQDLGGLFVDLDTDTGLLQDFPLPPSIVSRSGGDGHRHCIWLLREPAGVQAEKDALYSYLRRLCAALRGDLAAAEPARGLRLPGTHNQKYAPPRPVTIAVFDPDRRYNLSEFDAWLPADVITSTTPTTVLDLSTIPLGARNTTLYKLGRSLHAKQLPAPAIVEALRATNATCTPPLDVRELDAVVHQVLTQPDREDFAPDIALIHDAASALTLTSIADLLGEPDETVDYLVDDRIGCSSVNLLAGKPKAGKSTAARALSLEIARGGRFLDSGCLPRPVWYLALEDKRSEVRKHFRQMGATGTEPIRFLFRQPTADLVSQLHALATDEHPGLIVVDTLQRLIRAKDLNDYAEVTTKLTPVLTLARETGASVLLIHHASKSDRGGLDAVLGSTALAGSVDNVFLLTRTERYRVLSSVQRIGPDLPETVLLLDELSGQIRAGSSRHDMDVAMVQAAFVAALAAGDVLSRAELLRSANARCQLKHDALRNAVEAGTIRRTGAGTKADPHRYTSRHADSGSQVPSNSREPEFSLSSAGAFPKDSAPDCGSEVPTPIREPGNHNPDPEPLPAWVTEPDPPLLPGDSDEAFAMRDAAAEDEDEQL